MILVRAALIKIFQTFAIGSLALGVLATFLLSYSYISGDQQDRAEMVAAAEHIFRAPASVTSNASLNE